MLYQWRLCDTQQNLYDVGFVISIPNSPLSMLTTCHFNITDKKISNWGAEGCFAIKTNYSGFTNLSAMRNSNRGVCDSDTMGWLLLCY